MEPDVFAKRERALEDEFFHRVDEKLREELRRSMERDRSREALAAATGFSDNDLLDELVDSGITATTLLALAMVPAVMVAWCDSEMAKEEREAILKMAHERGIQEDGLAHQILDGWLDKRPNRSLLDTWQHYAQAVRGSLTEEAWNKLVAEVMQQSHSVAEAAGGVFGYGKVSATEKNMIAKIKEALA